jgi:hypothetical protein
MSENIRVQALLADIQSEDQRVAAAAVEQVLRPAIHAFATTVTDITLRRVFLQDYVNMLEVKFRYKGPAAHVSDSWQTKFCDEALLQMHQIKPATYYNGSRRQILIQDDVMRCTPTPL